MIAWKPHQSSFDPPSTGRVRQYRSGKDCTFTAIVLTNGRVDLNMIYESRGEVLDAVKTQSYSERSETVLPPGLLASAMKSKSWLCFPLKRPHFVIAIQPVIIP